MIRALIWSFVRSIILWILWFLEIGLVRLFSSRIVLDLVEYTLPTLFYAVMHRELLAVLLRLTFKEKKYGIIPNAYNSKYLYNLDSTRLTAKQTKEVQYSCTHAMDTYPGIMLFQLGCLPPIKRNLSTIGLLCDLFGFDFNNQDDWILKRHWMCTKPSSFLDYVWYFGTRNDVYDPVYYLIRDDVQKTFVLAIRGSTSINDWISDFATENEPVTIQNTLGYTHKGIMKAARNVYEAVIVQIRKNMMKAEYAEYELMITGHSLGAGTATLVSYLFMETEEEMEMNLCIIPRIRTITFAPPPVISANIAMKCASELNMTSVNLGIDIVTRLSEGALEKCHRALNKKDGLDTFDDHKTVEATLTKDYHDSTYESQNLTPGGQVLWYLPKLLDNESNSNSNFNAMDASNWMIFDATNAAQKDAIFGSIVFERMESYEAHLPNRYCGAVGISGYLQPRS